MTEATIHLSKTQFSEKEKPLLAFGDLSASLFLFESGVHALRLKGKQVELILLPYQGQQIWQAVVNGRNITMKSMFDEPQATTDYLSTYGGFLLHCGVTAMGTPSEEDTHPPHGELPNAPYQKASLVLGEDSKGSYIGLAGEYKHTVAFNHNYLAKPLVKVYADSPIFSADLVIENLKNVEMELMYLAHINFRPEDDAQIISSVKPGPKNNRVRQVIPQHISPKEGYLDFINDLAKHPEKHEVLKKGLNFDPEVVFYLDYLADKNGWAHSLLEHTDGSSSYMRHRPEQLDFGVRWICRTPDQDALGIADPATAEPEGYLAEKSKGNLKFIPALGSWRMDVEMGALDRPKTQAMTRHIQSIIE